ncbi:MAG: radical SAM protein, partial [Sphaerochaetaceae bacterium]|nr:radical SAM protein [Sphaerochaetaceae bacterium]
MKTSNEELMKMYEKCELCPNKCGVNRTAGQKGVCFATSNVQISFAGLHKGEEPCVAGKRGAGVIFFAFCPLHCHYCQNYQISNSANPPSIEVSIQELTEIMLELEKNGAYTLDLVTGTQFIPSIIIALKNAQQRGFKLPVVWNSSGFERVEILKVLNRYVDLYLMDVKTFSYEVAEKFCGMKKYVETIKKVMDYLASVQKRTFERNGFLYGTLVRHLVFPLSIEPTLDFLKWFKDYKDKCFLSLMFQFVSPFDEDEFDAISKKDYNRILEYLEEL